MIYGHYAFTATALLPCALSVWSTALEASDTSSIVTLLTHIEKRAAHLLSLRLGEPWERVVKLLKRLALADDPATRESQVLLPDRKDMADITALRLETLPAWSPVCARAGHWCPQRMMRSPAQMAISA